MRRQIHVLLCMVSACVFVSMFGPTPSLAKCPPPPSTSPLVEGEVGLFFDPAATETCGDLPIGLLSELYVVGRVPAGGIARFSLPEIMTASPPPGLTFFGLPKYGGPPGYELLIVIDACQVAQRIDPANCPVVQGDLIVLSVIEVMAFSPLNGVYCFQTMCPFLAGPTAFDPIYERCDNGAGGNFTGGDTMCIGFNVAPVPVAATTWGGIKSLYETP